MLEIAVGIGGGVIQVLYSIGIHRESGGPGLRGTQHNGDHAEADDEAAEADFQSPVKKPVTNRFPNSISVLR